MPKKEKKMRRFQAPDSMKKFCRTAQRSGKTLGFVPTMGYLHGGHIALIDKARKQNDEVVVSVFVNPIQFGPEEDFEAYPRDLPRDMDTCRDHGVAAVFVPEVKDLYPEGFTTRVAVGPMKDALCGASRPEHFEGVATVVLKLLEIIRPDRAYFGQKDAQQAIILNRMAEDFNLDTKIVVVPTVREKDGLALSSRNVYLTAEERAQAPCLHRALHEAQRAILIDGETDKKTIEKLMKNEIQGESLANLDYAKAVSAETLDDLDPLVGRILLAVAVRFGKARLIDNIMVTVPGRMATARHRAGG